MAYTPFNTRLTQAQMEENVKEIAVFLRAQGWSLEAIAGACGNFESECTMNPNDPERATGFPTSSESRTHGFGLPQWTPWYTRYGAWCSANGIAINSTDTNPSGQLIPQLVYLEYECINGIPTGLTWYSNHGYSYTWEQFKTSTDSPETLAKAFYWQYERSAAGNPGTRPEQARAWYAFLTGLPPDPVEGLPIWLLFKIRENNRRWKKR